MRNQDREGADQDALLGATLLDFAHGPAPT